MRLALLFVLLLAACSGHSSPPQPEGRLIPVDPSSLPDYKGNELYPGLVRAAP